MSRYHLVLEFESQDGQVLGRSPVPGFTLEPAMEWTTLALLRGGHPQPTLAHWRSHVQPLFSANGEGPEVGGFRIILHRDRTRIESPLFAKTYFNRFARRAAADLLKRGNLAASSIERYRLLAFFTETDPQRDGEFVVTPRTEPTTLPPVLLRGLTGESSRFGEPNEAEIPVFIPQAILDEAEQLTELAGPQETGGVLIGHLGRDASLEDLAVTVTAQIPVRHAEPSLHELVFTPDTWVSVEAAIALRARGEQMLGHWHSHPNKFFCKAECPPETRRLCPLMQEFFSEDDIALHETVFPRPFQVALVISNTESGLRHSLYGWQDGLITQRGFWILNANRPFAQANVVEPGGNPYETPCH